MSLQENSILVAVITRLKVGGYQFLLNAYSLEAGIVRFHHGLLLLVEPELESCFKQLIGLSIDLRQVDIVQAEVDICHILAEESAVTSEVMKDLDTICRSTERPKFLYILPSQFQPS